MSKTYDLTTKEGMKNSISYVKDNPSILINGPLVHFTTKAISSLLNSKEKVKKQVHIASEIIEKGKKEGVKSMKIKVSEQAGIDIQSTMKDLPIKCKLGSEGYMEIEVEYK